MCANKYRNRKFQFKAQFFAKGVKTSQEVRMLSSVTLNCQLTKIVRNLGFQLSELYLKFHKSIGWPLSLLAKVFLNFGELG